MCGPIGYVGLGAVLLLMVGFQEAEVRKAMEVAHRYLGGVKRVGRVDRRICFW